MYPETAMERYMNLLSEAIPGWMGDNISVSFSMGAKVLLLFIALFFYTRLDNSSNHFEILYSRAQRNMKLVMML